METEPGGMERRGCQEYSHPSPWRDETRSRNTPSGLQGAAGPGSKHKAVAVGRWRVQAMLSEQLTDFPMAGSCALPAPTFPLHQGLPWEPCSLQTQHRGSSTPFP